MNETEAIEAIGMHKEHDQFESWVEGTETALDMAVEALDKQIAYKPTPYTGYMIGGKGVVCKCGAVFLDKSTKYCGNCGQKILWEGEDE